MPRLLFRLLPAVSICALAFAAAALQRSPEQGVAFAVIDAEATRVQHSLSHRPAFSPPAPRVWSSRLDVRSSARWHSAPRYAV